MRTVKMAIWAIVALYVQVLIAPSLTLWRVMPELLLPFVVYLIISTAPSAAYSIIFFGHRLRSYHATADGLAHIFIFADSPLGAVGASEHKQTQIRHRGAEPYHAQWPLLSFDDTLFSVSFVSLERAGYPRSLCGFIQFMHNHYRRLSATGYRQASAFHRCLNALLSAPF